MRAKGREGGGEDVAGGDGIADVVHWLLLEQEWPGVGRQVLALPRWSPGGQLRSAFKSKVELSNIGKY